MGIAKSIEAYSVYDNYNADSDKFIRHLSDRLNADFIINIYDTAYHNIGNEYITSFEKKERFCLTITFDEYEVDKKTIELPTYSVVIPVKNVYDKSIEINFYPNESVHVMFLTFEHLWSSFIKELKFQHGDEDRKQAIQKYQTLRSEYSFILQKLRVRQILITTHAYYKIECVTAFEIIPKLTFGDIIKVVEEDKLEIFNFQSILEAKTISQLGKNFIDKEDLEIVFLDQIIT